MRRLLVLPAVVAAVLLGSAAPASAHAGGLVATDARSEVVAVTPAVPGLTVRTIEDGARVRLVNHTGAVVTAPAGAVRPGGELIWVESRVSPVGRRTDGDWSFTLDANGTLVTVTGVFVAEEPPAPLPWWLAAVAAAAGILLLARRIKRGDLLLCAAGTVAAVASIVHVTGSTMAVASAPPAGTFLSAAGINLLNWPLILGGVIAVWRGRPAGVLAVCAGAALTAVFVLPDVTSFHRAVLPFAGPAVVERVLVVLALGLGAGVAVAGARVLRALAENKLAENKPVENKPVENKVAEEHA
ncbi:hypothetical protein [Actinoplanes sp. NPDC051851]|uniref:hypothetical protein n=1 Tax=Actinoplanes sp. NPDC051851 TaxID=3154753 RepID=UPI003433CD47